LAFGEDESAATLVGNVPAQSGSVIAVPPKAPTNTSPEAVAKVLDDATRKKVLNAPKRIKQIETRLAAIDERLPSVEAETASAWNDPAELSRLSAELAALQSEQDRLYLEWEELLELAGVEK